jgi:hypothetical protein
MLQNFLKLNIYTAYDNLTEEFIALDMAIFLVYTIYDLNASVGLCKL